jgi:predicted hotdog family 3-hydroxylacyl-ACP dehydratase
MMQVSIEDILPHRPPMVLIDRLVRCDATSAVAVRTFAPGAYGTDGDRVLEPALIEGLAQTVAAMNGNLGLGTVAQPGEGMLVMVSDFEFPAAAVVGRPLELRIDVTRQLGAFHLAEGRIDQDGRIVASGSLSFYTEERPREAPAIP